MVMFGMMNFTAESATAVAENYGAIPALPAFMKLTGPYIRSSIEGGISTMSIFEFDDARADEAIAYLRHRYATFEKINGVAVTLEEWLGVGAVLELLEETNSVTEALKAVSFRI